MRKNLFIPSLLALLIAAAPFFGAVPSTILTLPTRTSVSPFRSRVASPTYAASSMSSP